ncbi:EVE domain-containing protein [Mucilaginibacter sp.]|uniref:EVE domain-containing protein n=1 Tax=Mucilaginibacter sp. TaxID=1882438 RepID=UPI0025E3D0F7|nr:EVE domain-containing protein [Mucilaginibacter sp.]
MKYWITVVSKDHISRGIAGGFMQANHGKPAPLRRMAAGDWVIIYSPKQSMNGTEPLQAFTAIGQLADDEVYQHKMSEDFIPYRRNVNYYKCIQTPILPLVNELDFIPNKKSWGYPFRFGFLEINVHDFGLIKTHMLTDESIPVNNK